MEEAERGAPSPKRPRKRKLEVPQGETVQVELGQEPSHLFGAAAKEGEDAAFEVLLQLCAPGAGAR